MEVVNPKVVVAFGRYAQAYVLNAAPHKVEVLKNMGCILKCANYYVVLSCHPAYVARNPKVLNAFRTHIRKAKAITEGRIPKNVLSQL